MNGPAWILLSIYKLNEDKEQVLLGNRLFAPGELSRVGPAAAQGHYQPGLFRPWRQQYADPNPTDSVS
jgi:hypothetical protein